MAGFETCAVELAAGFVAVICLAFFVAGNPELSLALFVFLLAAAAVILLRLSAAPSPSPSAVNTDKNDLPLIFLPFFLSFLLVCVCALDKRLS